MGPASHVAHVILSYAGQVVLATAGQLALVLGPPLLLSALMQPVASQSERWTRGLVGNRALWLAAGWVTTALHELGHAALALLFGHRVTHVKWFDFSAADGALGRVDHEYDPTSLYQKTGRFFIGVGPIVVGAIALAAASRLLLGVRSSSSPLVAAHAHAPIPLAAATRSLATLLGGAARDVGRIAQALSAARWQTWAFLYVAYLAGSAMRLSTSDLRAAAAGSWTLGWLVLAANALSLWIGAFATTIALRVAGALALCDAAILTAIALQLLVGGAALSAARAAAWFRARDAALAGG